MTRFAVLEHDADGRYGRSLPTADVFCDLEALLTRLREEPGAIRLIVLAPDLEDPAAAARRLLEVDPDLGLVRASPTAETSASHELVAALTGSAGERLLEANRLASVATLTAEIAHDIGTPLTAILGYAELLAGSSEDEKNRRRAQTIVEQVHRVTELIDTLVRLARSASVPPALVDLSHVLDKALGFYREKLKRRGIEIDREYAPVTAVLGNPDRLQQAFMNLLLEVVEAMPQGGTLGVSVAERAAKRVAVRFRVLGSGTRPIPKEEGRVRLVTRTIAEEHGGRLELTRALAGGDEFAIELPTAPASSGAER